MDSKSAVEMKPPVVLRILQPQESPKGPSLLTRIRNAKTVEDVDKLMVEAETYKFAAPKTRRAWVRAAARRKVAITNPQPEEKPKVSEQEKKGKKRSAK